MAICAASYLVRRTKSEVLAVVTVHVGFYGHVKDAIALHHFVVSMTLQTDFGVKFAIDVAVRITELFDFVQTMTVMTGGRIKVAYHNRFAVTGVKIIFMVIMATGTLGNDSGLVILPVSMRVNIVVAGGACARIDPSSIRARPCRFFSRCSVRI